MKISGLLLDWEVRAAKRKDGTKMVVATIEVSEDTVKTINCKTFDPPAGLADAMERARRGHTIEATVKGLRADGKYLNITLDPQSVRVLTTDGEVVVEGPFEE